MASSLSKQMSWEKLSPLPDPRYGSPKARSSHGLSIVKKDKTLRIIICGGEHIARTPIEPSNAYWSADFNSDSGACKWTLITGSGTTPPPDRIAHAQAVHKNCVYIFGGRGGITMDEAAMNDLWKLDCSGEIGTETWSRIEVNGTPPQARSFHRMVCIGNSLYVFGGCTADHGRANDLHRFDIPTKTWFDLGSSPLLRGRGGPNLMPLSGGSKLGVVAGFAGEETADGHVFDIKSGKWSAKLLDPNKELKGMRPRSVCACGSFPSLGYSVVFGGEVDPSDRGHEGAGAFESDVVVLDESSGAFIASIANGSADDNDVWPQTRGWSDAASEDYGNGDGKFFVFGGLSGDDQNPERLSDLWALSLTGRVCEKSPQ